MNRFIGHYGEYLVILNKPGHGTFSIAWYFPKEREFGALLGEDHVYWKEEPLDPWDRVLHKVNCAVENTLGPDDSRNQGGFLFTKWSGADHAFRVANRILCNEPESLPEP